MSSKHRIEIYSAGCPACEEAIDIVNRVAQSGCEINVLDMHDKAVAECARSLGIQRVPAVVVDGRLAECCAGGGTVDAAIIGKSLSS